MREPAYTKARRYLTEGRVVLTSVTPTSVHAMVRGDGAIYRSSYRARTWTCDCPARTNCAHLIALRLITAPDLKDPH